MCCSDNLTDTTESQKFVQVAAQHMFDTLSANKNWELSVFDTSQTHKTLSPKCYFNILTTIIQALIFTDHVIVAADLAHSLASQDLCG